MFRTSFYDRISLICLMIGCGFIAVALYCCFESEWLKMTAFGIVSIMFWHLSALFARYAIAASGRQK